MHEDLGKIDDVTVVANFCGDEEKCEKLKKICDNAKDEKCAVGCCDTDLCNAGSPVSFSVFLMTVSSAGSGTTELKQKNDNPQAKL